MGLSPRWLDWPPESAGAPLRLFCLPHAGGGAAMYRGWRPMMEPRVEVVGVRPPGRENRFGERGYATMEALVADLVEVLAPHLDRPYGLFGHSFGAAAAFELTRSLEAASLPPPQALFVAACAPPGGSGSGAELAQCSDGELLEALRARGGLSAESEDSPELFALFAPVIRQDIRLLAGYGGAGAGPVGCPVVAMGGASDVEAPPDALAGWEAWAPAGFELLVFDGGHFFVSSAVSEVAGIVADRLARARLPQGPPAESGRAMR